MSVRFLLLCQHSWYEQSIQRTNTIQTARRSQNMSWKCSNRQFKFIKVWLMWFFLMSLSYTFSSCFELHQLMRKTFLSLMFTVFTNQLLTLSVSCLVTWITRDNVIIAPVSSPPRATPFTFWSRSSVICLISATLCGIERWRTKT